MLKGISSLGFGIILAASIAGGVQAQETNDLQAAFGAVVKSSAEELVISQYNSEQEADQEVAYVVDPQTHLEGAAAVSDIAPGEEVEILYEELNGGKVARFISKELLPEDEIEADIIQEETNQEDAVTDNLLNAISEDL